MKVQIHILFLTEIRLIAIILILVMTSILSKKELLTYVSSDDINLKKVVGHYSLNKDIYTFEKHSISIFEI